MALLGAGAAWALPVQITDHAGAGCAIDAPVASSDASVVAFSSTCDLTGGNTDGNREIFQYVAGAGVSQLTDTTGCANMAPALSSDGSVVAFDSDCDLTGQNADGSVEIFVYDGSGFTQVTAGQFCTSAAPSLDAAGTKVAFDSDCDLTGANADRSSEIFQATIGGATTQLTSDTAGLGCGSFDAASNAAGDLIAFDSDCDLTGQNTDQIVEIFQVASDRTVTQLTFSIDDTCGSGPPASDASGMYVSFESSCDFTGGNADGSVEIFEVGPTRTKQLTAADQTPMCESQRARASAGGEWVVYQGFCDPTGANPDGGFEVFRATEAGVLQVTSGAACSSFAPVVASAARSAVFVSDCDPAGSNADGSEELFVESLCVCGSPASGRQPPDLPTATDALFALRAAVGSALCASCDCDVNSSGGITATDALLILKAAVGGGVTLVCP